MNTSKKANQKAIRMGVMLMLMLVCGLSGFSQNKKQYLNSIVQPTSCKQIFSYDDNGNNILEIQYDWRENNTWIERIKYVKK